MRTLSSFSVSARYISGIAGCVPVLIFSLVASFGAENVPCPDAGWSTVGASDLEHELICEGTSGATEFLASCGLEEPDSTVATVHYGMLECFGAPAQGMYDAGTGELSMASLAACNSAKTPEDVFGRMQPEAAYRSIAAHEAAHAILHANGLKPAQWVGNEYIASVVQLSTMPAISRSALIRSSMEPRPVELNEISDLIYAFEPILFSVRSYLHYSDLEDGCDFIGTILEDRVSFTARRAPGWRN